MSFTKLIKAIKGNYSVNEFRVIILGGLCVSSHFLFFLPLLILYFEFLQQFFSLCHVPFTEHLLHCLQRGYLQTNHKELLPMISTMIEHLLSVKLYIKNTVTLNDEWENKYWWQHCWNFFIPTFFKMNVLFYQIYV